MTRHARPTTGRVAPGDVLARFTLTTVRDEQLAVPLPDVLTHLQFRRFAGCPVCNVHLRSFARRHDEIVTAGVREVVLFHSSAQAMQPHQGDLPFATIADPRREHYAAFGVESSLRSLLIPRLWASLIEPYAWTVSLRELRANRRRLSIRDGALGLPADFLVADDGRVVAAHYGRHADDQWSVDAVLELARDAR